MPEMIQVNELVTFECPNCGYITKGKRGEKMNCPKCQPDFKGYFLGSKNTEQANQPDSGE
jgi:ssDNA-binding Zn-finger/Zn-ribbon topoisomerase 1